MRIHIGRVAAAISACIALLAPGAAHAVKAEHVEWSGYGYSYCTTGSSSGWECTYDLYSETCPEVAVAGSTLASCFLYIRATMAIVPAVNAAGRLVGCTSGGRVVLDGRSYARFDSTVPAFDNTSINEVFVGQMYDGFSDGKPGLLQLAAYEQGQSSLTSAQWVVAGGFAGTCNRGTGYNTAPATGTVDVHV